MLDKMRVMTALGSKMSAYNYMKTLDLLGSECKMLVEKLLSMVDQTKKDLKIDR